MERKFEILVVKRAFDILATKSAERALLDLMDEVGPDEMKAFLPEIRAFAEEYLASALENRASGGPRKAIKVLHALTDVAISIIEEENL